LIDGVGVWGGQGGVLTRKRKDYLRGIKHRSWRISWKKVLPELCAWVVPGERGIAKKRVRKTPLEPGGKNLRGSDYPFPIEKKIFGPSQQRGGGGVIESLGREKEQRILRKKGEEKSPAGMMWKLHS